MHSEAKNGLLLSTIIALNINYYRYRINSFTRYRTNHTNWKERWPLIDRFLKSSSLESLQTHLELNRIDYLPLADLEMKNTKLCVYLIFKWIAIMFIYLFWFSVLKSVSVRIGNRRLYNWPPLLNLHMFYIYLYNKQKCCDLSYQLYCRDWQP